MLLDIQAKAARVPEPKNVLLQADAVVLQADTVVESLIESREKSRAGLDLA